MPRSFPRNLVFSEMGQAYKCLCIDAKINRLLRYHGRVAWMSLCLFLVILLGMNCIPVVSMLDSKRTMNNLLWCQRRNCFLAALSAVYSLHCFCKICLPLIDAFLPLSLWGGTSIKETEYFVCYPDLACFKRSYKLRHSSFLVNSRKSMSYGD